MAGVQFIDQLFPTSVSPVLFDTAILAVFGVGNYDKIRPFYPILSNETVDARPAMQPLATHYTFACPNRFIARGISNYVSLSWQK
jgi:hypothetical protein